jgi:hypothetical protein
MAENKFESDLERKIFELILSFPERIDVIEERSEESALALARRISRLVRSETERKARTNVSIPKY